MIPSSKPLFTAPLFTAAVRLRLAVALAPLIFGISGPSAQAQDAGDSPPAQSQPELRPAHRARRPQSVADQLDRLTTQLHLTPAQQGRVKIILDRRQAQILELRGAGGLTATDRVTKLQAAKRDALEKIDAVLTDEQRKIFRPSRQRPNE
jgi:protein CpxP